MSGGPRIAVVDYGAGNLVSIDQALTAVGARVTIARGDKECRVVVYLKPTPESEAAEGREYVRG